MRKTDLLPALKEACKYIDKRKERINLPILTTIRLEVKDGQLTIDATNLEDWFTCTMPTDCRDMKVCIPAKVFRDQINAMDAGNIQIGYLSDIDAEVWTTPYDRAHSTHKAGALTIKQGRSYFKLWTDMPVEEYPAKPSASIDWNTEEVTLAIGVTATIYHHTIEADSDKYMTYNEEKTAANKLFPKYIKIEGVIAKKNGTAWLDYTHHDDGRSTRTAYCMYQYGDQEQKVSHRELENYEKIELGGS